MRGSTSFEKLYRHPALGRNKKASTGRCADLVERRNELIMYRYHYYGAHSGERYDTIVGLLSNEFYLSIRTINGIIESHADVRRRIMDENPSLDKLRKKYGFLTWG